MEQNTRYIVVVTTTSINLPRLGIWDRGGGREKEEREGGREVDIVKKYLVRVVKPLGTCTIPFILHSLICLSSAADMSRGSVG